MLEEFNKTREVADQMATENIFTPNTKFNESSRLPGPDVILEGIAHGRRDDSPTLDSPPEPIWRGPSSPSLEQPLQLAHGNSAAAAQVPGIPLLLAQARGQAAVAPAPTAHSHDADNALLPMMSSLDLTLPEIGLGFIPNASSSTTIGQRNDKSHPLSPPWGSRDYVLQKLNDGATPFVAWPSKSHEDRAIDGRRIHESMDS